MVSYESKQELISIGGWKRVFHYYEQRHQVECSFKSAI